MAYASINGIKLHYRIDGTKSDAPWLVLSNSLGSDVGMWAPQIQAFAAHFRVLRYYTRGHGRSEAPRGPYTIEQLTGDVIGLMDHLGIARWQIFGGSWGSTLALAYAEKHPDRVTELVLRGIFLLRKQEIDWFYQRGADAMFPDAWEEYLAPIPPEERGDLLRTRDAEANGFQWVERRVMPEHGWPEARYLEAASGPCE